MELTKEMVLSAVRALIKSYQSGDISHSSKCPICTIYGDGTRCSDLCLNFVFEDKQNSSNPCMQRGLKYQKLDHTNYDNDKTLAKYWQNVYDLLEITPEEEILKMSVVMRIKILILAERYRLSTDR